MVNSEITVGNLINVVTMIVIAIGAFHALKGELSVIKQVIQHQGDRVDRMERRHEERMTVGEHRMAKLEENHNLLTRMMEHQRGQYEGISQYLGPERRKHPREE
jgi:hypothetical protein